MDLFYMLYVEGGGAPTHQHRSPENAKQEAERLARQTGRRVHVLKSVASCLKTDVQWSQPDPVERSVEDDEIPF